MEWLRKQWNRVFGKTKQEGEEMSDEVTKVDVVEKTPWYLQKEKWLWIAGGVVLVLNKLGVSIPAEWLEQLPFTIPSVSLGIIGTLILNTVLKILKGLYYKYIVK